MSCSQRRSAVQDKAAVTGTSYWQPVSRQQAASLDTSPWQSRAGQMVSCMTITPQVKLCMLLSGTCMQGAWGLDASSIIATCNRQRCNETQSGVGSIVHGRLLGQTCLPIVSCSCWSSVSLFIVQHVVPTRPTSSAKHSLFIQHDDCSGIHHGESTPM